MANMWKGNYFKELSNCIFNLCFEIFKMMLKDQTSLNDLHNNKNLKSNNIHYV
jgi:hypothetical protein